MLAPPTTGVNDGLLRGLGRTPRLGRQAASSAAVVGGGPRPRPLLPWPRRTFTVLCCGGLGRPTCGSVSHGSRCQLLQQHGFEGYQVIGHEVHVAWIQRGPHQPLKTGARLILHQPNGTHDRRPDIVARLAPQPARQ